MSSVIEAKETQLHTYKVTSMPLEKGFLNVLQRLKPIFPKESTKITVNLEGLGETQLAFDAKNGRIYGLTKWYRERGVRPGHIITIEVVEPFKKYAFSTFEPPAGFEKKEQTVKARLTKVRPRQPASESSILVGKGGEYHVIGRLAEMGLEVYLPVADVSGVDALVRLPNGLGYKEIQVKTSSKGERPVFQPRIERRKNLYMVLHIAETNDFWILPSEVFYKNATKAGGKMQLILTESKKKELHQYYNNWFLLKE